MASKTKRANKAASSDDDLPISSPTVGYLTYVYAVSALGLLLSAYGAHLHLTEPRSSAFHGSHALYWVQVVCVLILGVGYTQGTKGLSAWRLCVFAVCAFAAGLNVGTWIQFALQEAGVCRGKGWEWVPDADWLKDFLPSHIAGSKCDIFHPFVRDAFVLSAGLYLSLMLASLGGGTFWRRAFGGVLVIAFWAVLGVELLATMGWVSYSVYDMVYIKFGLAMYTVKVLVDTEGMAERASRGEGGDIINDALTVLLNFLHMFIRIIVIMAQRAADEKKRKRE